MKNHLTHWAIRVYQFWVWLVEPPRHITDPEIRRRSRLLASLVLPFTPALVIVWTWDWVGEAYRTFVVIGILTCSAAYVLARLGRYWIAAVLGVGFLSISPFVLLFSQGDFSVAGVTSSLIWLLPAFIVSYLLLTLRGVALTAVAVILGIVSLVVTPSPITLDSLVYVSFVLAVCLVLTLIAALARDYDLHEIKRQSGALAESEARYRDLFSASVEGIVVHKNGVLLDANPAFEDMVGMPLSELIGRNVIDFIAPEFRALARQNLNSDERYEVKGIVRDGRRFWVEIQGSYRLYRGEQVRVVAVRDINARKESEMRQLELTIEREKVNVLQRVISDMSHDLKTPLSVLKTSIYLIRRLREDPPRLEKQIDVLDSQILHLQHLLDDMLSMARLDKADVSHYSFRWMNANLLLRDLISEMQEMAEKRRQTLTFEQKPIPPTLLDETEFKRMMRHLIQNAINFTPENGQIDVISRHERPADAPEQALGEIVIEVRDTGPGISALELPYIFERFYRADSARTTGKGGTGLGLSIARKVAEAHGGTISVESEPGKGSIFTVRLPVNKKMEIRGTAPVSAGEPPAV